MITFGSCFDGIGGFTLGFERAGMTPLWTVEIDKDCRKTTSRHWPGLKQHEDIKNVGRENLERVDLICGGFPCQDLSVAGKRAGLAGERSGLWFEFARVIGELEPEWVVIENVPGLLSSDEARDFAVIVQWLVERGYGVVWRVLDAQYFGVAQRRRRVFIVGHLGDGRAAQVLFESEGMFGDTPSRREKGKTAPTLFASGAGTGRTASCGTEAEFCIEVAGSLGCHRTGGWGNDLDNNGAFITSFDTRNGRQDDGATMTLQAKNTGGWSVNCQPIVSVRTAQTHANSHGIAEDVAHTLDDAQGQAVCYNLMPQNSTKDFKAKETDISQSLSCNGNHSGDQGGTYVSIAPTLRAMPNQGPGRMADDAARMMMVRRLTPLECERLQGFPDNWTTGQSDSTRYRQIGNAVAVPVIEWIGRRIMTDTNLPKREIVSCETKCPFGKI